MDYRFRPCRVLVCSLSAASILLFIVARLEDEATPSNELNYHDTVSQRRRYSAPWLYENDSTSTEATLAVPTAWQNNGYGYLLELNSSDQLTGGAMNVFSYMCLAAQISPRLLVVEPFVVNSTFGAVLSVGDRESLARENNVKLSDIYDMKPWKSLAGDRHYNELVSWEDFLQNAPRSVILVENQWWYDCDLDKLQNRFSGFFRLYHFRVIRRVCLDFKLSGAMSLEEFVEKVYGEVSPENTSLIIDRLPGIGELSPWQTAVDIDCNKGMFADYVATSVFSSMKIKRDANIYIDKYLNGNQDYISVMVRLEHLIMRASVEEVQYCLNRVYHELENLKNDTLKSTFVALDTGKYGSVEFLMGTRGNMVPILSKTHEFVDRIYNGSMSYDEWENSFEEVTGLTTGGVGGYVAMLQKEIALQGHCIVLAGGGSFQISAANFFMSLHSEEPCILRFGYQCEKLF